MNYVELTINGVEYKLRLTTRGCVSLEKALGCNPLQVFWDLDSGKLPKVTDIVTMLNIMLQGLNHGINLDKTYDLFDTYLAEGHQMFDIIQVFMEVFQAAGFIAKESEDSGNTEKN